VRRKDLCGSVRAVYVLETLPDVSGPGLVEAGPQEVNHNQFLLTIGVSHKICEDSLCPRKAARCKRARPRRGGTLQEVNHNQFLLTIGVSHRIEYVYDKY
jgi:hypothetical protein